MSCKSIYPDLVPACRGKQATQEGRFDQSAMVRRTEGQRGKHNTRGRGRWRGEQVSQARQQAAFAIEIREVRERGGHPLSHLAYFDSQHALLASIVDLFPSQDVFRFLVRKELLAGILWDHI